MASLIVLRPPVSTVSSCDAVGGSCAAARVVRRGCALQLGEHAGPARLLHYLRMALIHTCYRITDIDRSVAFYEALGFKEVGRIPIREEAVNVFMNQPGDGDMPRLELTYNFGVDSYELGDAYGHIAITRGGSRRHPRAPRPSGDRAGEAAVLRPRGRLAPLLRPRSRRLPDRDHRAAVASWALGCAERERSCEDQAMDTETIDQEYKQLQSEFEDAAKSVQEFAQKLQSAADGGDEKAKEYLLDLKQIALDIKDEQMQVNNLLTALHQFVANAAQQVQRAPAQQQPMPQQPMGRGGFGMGGMGGGGMFGGFLGGGFRPGDGDGRWDRPRPGPDQQHLLRDLFFSPLSEAGAAPPQRAAALPSIASADCTMTSFG